MVPADSRRISRVPRYSGCHYAGSALRVPAYHRLWGEFPLPSPRADRATSWSYNPRQASPPGGFGLFPVRSPLLGESLSYFLFLGVLRCFSSPGSPPRTAWIATKVAGLSHSEIPGSQAICAYPGLVAAYHVLHRLDEPRHPPSALNYFRLGAVAKKNGTAAHTLSCVVFNAMT